MGGGGIDWLTIGAWGGVILTCGCAYAAVRVFRDALAEDGEAFGDVPRIPEEMER